MHWETSKTVSFDVSKCIWLKHFPAEAFEAGENAVRIHVSAGIADAITVSDRHRQDIFEIDILQLASANVRKASPTPCEV